MRCHEVCSFSPVTLASIDNSGKDTASDNSPAMRRKPFPGLLRCTTW